MNTEFDAILLNRLLRVRENLNIRYGICSQLIFCEDGDEDEETGEYYSFEKTRMNEMFQEWPMYSGNPLYPVPHQRKGPEDAYKDTEDNKWNKRTIYGRNRWNLLNFMIAEVEKNL